MSETKPARLIRPADDSAFFDASIIAFLQGGNENIVIVRRNAWETRTPGMITALSRLTPDDPAYFGG